MPVFLSSTEEEGTGPADSPGLKERGGAGGAGGAGAAGSRCGSPGSATPPHDDLEHSIPATLIQDPNADRTDLLSSFDIRFYVIDNSPICRPVGPRHSGTSSPKTPRAFQLLYHKVAWPHLSMSFYIAPPVVQKYTSRVTARRSDNVIRIPATGSSPLPAVSRSVSLCRLLSTSSVMVMRCREHLLHGAFWTRRTGRRIRSVVAAIIAYVSVSRARHAHVALRRDVTQAGFGRSRRFVRRRPASRLVRDPSAL
ncbi:hypothetical protein EVAR_39468_1 [Eumeta japonica]|uniref:Uncharacterized protein n=1 Tax=Eumeta variegata TaxID=151549 RepID=A0A4C1W0T0_EUMVA|nr:hypothetical protein EVAR_39468_1 [Eumeta japonica]